MKLKLSRRVERMLNQIKGYYIHPDCQKGLSAISQERLRTTKLKLPRHIEGEIKVNKGLLHVSNFAKGVSELSHERSAY